MKEEENRIREMRREEMKNRSNGEKETIENEMRIKKEQWVTRRKEERRKERKVKEWKGNN